MSLQPNLVLFVLVMLSTVQGSEPSGDFSGYDKYLAHKYYDVVVYKGSVSQTDWHTIVGLPNTIETASTVSLLFFSLLFLPRPPAQELLCQIVFALILCSHAADIVFLYRITTTCRSRTLICPLISFSMATRIGVCTLIPTAS